MNRLGPSIAVCLAALAAGCYRSHGRDDGAYDAGGDAAPIQDAGPVVPIEGRCPPGYIKVAAAIRSGPRGSPSGAVLSVYASDLRELYADSHGGDHRFDLCFPEIEAPLNLTFGQHPGENHILGVDTDFDSESWERHLHLSQYDTSSPGRLIRQAPGSRFVIHLSSNVVREIDESPFDAFCRGVLDKCQIRFIELSTEDQLLGGAAFEQRLPGDELVLDTHGSTLGTGSFEVALPADGLLAGLPLTVRPLDCRGDVGPSSPGEIDLYRCAYAGIGTVTDVADDRARGTLSFVTGPTLVADTVVARLGSTEDGLEAYAYAPCCTGGESPVLAFGEVRELEGGGPRREDLRVRVDAPGYEHAFVYTFNEAHRPLAQQFERTWDFGADGHLDITIDDMPPYFLENNGGFSPLDEMWVGAVTTEDVPPWAAGRPIRSVRRRVVW